MTQTEIRARLLALAEPDYQQFNAKLLPGVDNILGVRMPHLHKLAKAIAREGWEAYATQALPDGVSHEEILVRGLVLGYAKAPWSEIAPYVAGHVRLLSNWSACDVFCGILKPEDTDREAVWQFICPYFEAHDTYGIRFAVVMALHFLDPAHLDALLTYFDAINHEDYYVRMAVAWAVSMAYVAMPELVAPYLQDNRLDDWTHNKALQKIIESRQVDDATRQQMRTLKRKRRKTHAQA